MGVQDTEKARLAKIHTEFVSRQVALERMTQMASLASASYKTQQGWKNLNKHLGHSDYGGCLDSWEVATSPSGKPLVGTYSTIFVDKRSGEYVLAVKGTSSLSDGVADVGLMLGLADNARVTEATGLMSQLKGGASAVSMIVGHSLGGQISEFLGISKGIPYVSFNGPSFDLTLADASYKQKLAALGPELGTYVVNDADMIGNAPSFQRPDGATVIVLPNIHGVLLDQHFIGPMISDLRAASAAVITDRVRVETKFQTVTQMTMTLADGQSERLQVTETRGLLLDNTTVNSVDLGGKLVASTTTLAPPVKDGLVAGTKAGLHDAAFNLLAPKDMQIPLKDISKHVAVACTKTWAQKNVERFVKPGYLQDLGGIAAAGLVDVVSGDYQAALHNSVTSVGNQIVGSLGIPLVYSSNTVAASTGRFGVHGTILSRVEHRQEANLQYFAGSVGAHWAEVEMLYDLGGMTIQYNAEGMGAHGSVFGSILDGSAGLMSGTETCVVPKTYVVGNTLFTETRDRAFRNELTLALNVAGRSFGGALLCEKQVIRTVKRQEAADRGSLKEGSWSQKDQSGWERKDDLQAIQDIKEVTKRIFHRSKKVNVNELEFNFTKRRHGAEVTTQSGEFSVSTQLEEMEFGWKTQTSKNNGPSSTTEFTTLKSDTATKTTTHVDGSDLFAGPTVPLTSSVHPSGFSTGESHLHTTTQTEVEIHVQQGDLHDVFESETFSGYEDQNWQGEQSLPSQTTSGADEPGESTGKRRKIDRVIQDSLFIRLGYQSTNLEGTERTAESQIQRVYQASALEAATNKKPLFSREVVPPSSTDRATEKATTTVTVHSLERKGVSDTVAGSTDIKGSGSITLKEATFSSQYESSAVTLEVRGPDDRNFSYGSVKGTTQTSMEGTAAGIVYSEDLGVQETCQLPPDFKPPPKPEIPTDARTSSGNYELRKEGGGTDWLGRRIPRVYDLYFQGKKIGHFEHWKDHWRAEQDAMRYRDDLIAKANAEHAANVKKQHQQWEKDFATQKKAYENAKSDYEKHHGVLETNVAHQMREEMLKKGYDEMDVNGVTLTPTDKVEMKTATIDLRQDEKRVVDDQITINDGATTRNEADTSITQQDVHRTQLETGEETNTRYHYLNRHRFDHTEVSPGTTTCDMFGKVSTIGHKTQDDHSSVLKVYEDGKQQEKSTLVSLEQTTKRSEDVEGGFLWSTTTTTEQETKFKNDLNGDATQDGDSTTSVNERHQLSGGATRGLQSLFGGLTSFALRKATGDKTAVTEGLGGVVVSASTSFLEGHAASATQGLLKAGKLTMGNASGVMIGVITVTTVVSSAWNYHHPPPSILSIEDETKRNSELVKYKNKCLVNSAVNFVGAAASATALVMGKTVLAGSVGFLLAPIFDVVNYFQQDSEDRSLVTLAGDVTGSLIGAGIGIGVSTVVASQVPVWLGYTAATVGTMTLGAQAAVVVVPAIAGALVVFGFGWLWRWSRATIARWKKEKQEREEFEKRGQEIQARWGLKEKPTDHEINKAYRKKALQYHPDRNNNSEESGKKFRECHEEFEVLNGVFAQDTTRSQKLASKLKRLAVAGSDCLESFWRSYDALPSALSDKIADQALSSNGLLAEFCIAVEREIRQGLLALDMQSHVTLHIDSCSTYVDVHTKALEVMKSLLGSPTALGKERLLIAHANNSAIATCGGGDDATTTISHDLGVAWHPEHKLFLLRQVPEDSSRSADTFTPDDGLPVASWFVPILTTQGEDSVWNGQAQPLQSEVSREYLLRSHAALVAHVGEATNKSEK